MFSKVCIFLTILLTAAGWQDEVKQIDQQIETLKELQNKYISSAKRESNNAMRWQFQNRNYTDARRAWEKAAQDKQKAQEIQDQIDDLEKRKTTILKEHGKHPSS